MSGFNDHNDFNGLDPYGNPADADFANFASIARSLDGSQASRFFEDNGKLYRHTIRNFMLMNM